jgi:hypothetical protein
MNAFAVARRRTPEKCDYGVYCSCGSVQGRPIQTSCLGVTDQAG